MAELARGFGYAQRRSPVRLTHGDMLWYAQQVMGAYLLRYGQVRWDANGKTWLVNYDGTRYSASRQGVTVIAGSIATLVDTIGIYGVAKRA